MTLRCLPSSFGSIWLTVLEEMWFEEFQDGGHLGHWNRTILAILNFHNTPMPPIMFKLNQTYRSVADVIWRFSRWLPWWSSWISERNHFSNSISPCCPNAFHQVSAKSDTILMEISKLKKILMRAGPWSTDHDISWSGANLQVTPMPPTKF